MLATIIFINDEPELVFESDTDIQIIEKELKRIKKETKKEYGEGYHTGPYVHTHEVSVYEEINQRDQKRNKS